MHFLKSISLLYTVKDFKEDKPGMSKLLFPGRVILIDCSNALLNK